MIRGKYVLDRKCTTFIANILRGIHDERADGPNIADGTDRPSDRSRVNGASRKTVLEAIPRRLEWSAVDDIKNSIFLTRKRGLGDQEDDGAIRVKGLGWRSILSNGNVDRSVGIEEIQCR